MLHRRLPRPSTALATVLLLANCVAARPPVPVAALRASLPSVSPDGRWIAFIGGRADSGDLYVMRTDGSRPRRVATTAEPETSQPAWTPDGRSLYVTATVGSGDAARSAVFRFDVETGRRQRVLDSLDATLEHVSADGQRLLLSSGAFPSVSLWESAPSGGGLRRVVSGRGVHYWGRFSPDGRRIAYVRMVPGRGATLRIEVSDGDGSGARAVTDSTSRAETPAWSPDGQWIALQRRVDGNTDLYLVRFDGSGLRRLTDAPGLDEVPTWSRDARHLYFQSDRDGTMGIHSLRLSDGHVQRISP